MTRPSTTIAPAHRTFWTGLLRTFASGAALTAGALAVAVPAWMYAAPVGTLQTFTNGTTADAALVNGNFTALKTALDSHETQLTAVTPMVFAFNGRFTRPRPAPR